jgi:leucyl aminopeptidase
MFQSIKIGEDGYTEAVVLGLYDDKEIISDSPLRGDPAVEAALSRRECTGEKENLVEAFPYADGRETRVLLLGLGKRDKLILDDLRKLAATLGRRLAQAKVEIAAIELAPALAQTGLDVTACGKAFGESLGILAWNYDTFRGSAAKPKTQTDLTLHASDDAFREGMAHGLKLATSVNLARNLSQTPPNVATPLWMAQQAGRVARENGLTCRVIQNADLEAERLDGLHNVGKASAHPPCLIRLEYRPEKGSKGSDRPPIVFVGKTITYDTGGLSLKTREGMVGMKRDKDGGCAVLGAMQAIGGFIKPDFPVVGILVAAENCVSDSSMRPDDVITYRNGVTVEVTNTDAEGRLVLADGLCWACEVEKAALIVDLATLTGGVVVALGSTYAGLFCDDDGLRTQLEAASAASGERLWRLPLHAEYCELMKSPIADLANSNANRKAHPIQGAAFLSHFVTEGTPWAHIDIAGVHTADADKGPFVKGPTGFGVRLLAELVEGMRNTN